MVNRIIWREKPDLVYSNMIASSPWQIPMFLLLPKNKTINTAHQGRVHEGMGHYKYYNFLRDILYKRIKSVNMFSKSQVAYFRERYPKSKIYQFPLGLKDFGEATKSKQEDGYVHFLSFGSINYVKHIDLLIDAACNIYEQGYKNFKVKIAGMCSDWNSTYVPHIKYPEIFENDIRMIDNNEIANIFKEADFFIQPYRVISQSGPFKIAMNYNTPLITSDLPGFTDEMEDGITGFIFKTNDVKSLEQVLIKAIDIKNSKKEYCALTNRMKGYVEKVYSKDALVRKYTNMFNDVIDKI
ncbi:glycosyltransferase family 4 protein [Bacteroides graminisolvens]|uniref:glycosyltransferase family 4 protein n=1 Tax=Bacteroides graminisolvens TaxID=477666 RepID=UPI0023EFE513|nr:glycosyltransferase family 4 protein [Bacteroides graminisolvens]